MLKVMRAVPTDLLLSAQCRHFLAKSNFEKRGRAVREYSLLDAGVMPGTVAHNRHELDDQTFATASRPGRLIHALSAIEGVFGNTKNLSVLSIGPRTEMELMHLVGLGFAPHNVHALDLVSSSPWIDPGDMHAMPYADRSFDITISAWVLAYSKDPGKAIREMVRVTRHDGLIAIGATFNPRADEVDYADQDSKIVGTIFRHTAQYKEFIGANLGRVHFEDEPVQNAKGAVMIVARVVH